MAFKKAGVSLLNGNPSKMSPTVLELSPRLNIIASLRYEESVKKIALQVQTLLRKEKLKLA